MNVVQIGLDIWVIKRIHGENSVPIMQESLV